MPTLFTEKTTTGRLDFEFSDNWQVCKYDDQAFYAKIKNKGIKAVDFVALSQSGILLVEVKYVTATDDNSRLCFSAQDDAVNEIKNQLTPEQLVKIRLVSARPYLVDEVCKKVTDTVLGLFAAYRKQGVDGLAFTSPLFTSVDTPILVVLFLERNTALNQPKHFKPLASHLKLEIEKRLSYLGNITVGVVNTLTLPSGLGIAAQANG